MLHLILAEWSLLLLGSVFDLVFFGRHWQLSHEGLRPSLLLPSNQAFIDLFIAGTYTTYIACGIPTFPTHIVPHESHFMELDWCIAAPVYKLGVCKCTYCVRHRPPPHPTPPPQCLTSGRSPRVLLYYHTCYSLDCGAEQHITMTCSILHTPWPSICV